MIEIDTGLFLSWVQALILPLFRILGFISIAPFFSDSSIPTSVKIAVGLLLTLATLPAVVQPTHLDLVSLQGIVAILVEIFIGLVLGFSVRLIFSAIDYAGQFLGLVMGFGFASFYDVHSSSTTLPIGSLLNLLALLVFISLDGHLSVLSLLIKSTHTIPINDSLQLFSLSTLVQLSGNIFSAGLQLCLPVIAILLTLNIALAVLTRAAPQLNIFVIGFPVTIVVGLISFYLVLAELQPSFVKLVSEAVAAMSRIILESK